jgi:hypothetical protein
MRRGYHMNDIPNWYSRLRTEPFEEKTFTSEMILSIEQRLHTPKKTRKIHFVKAGFVAISTIIGLSIVILVPHPWERSLSTGIPDQVPVVSVETPVLSPLPTPMPIPYYATILDRMLNSVDNFHDISGVYHEYYKSFDSDNTIRFEIEEGRNPGSYSSIERTGEEGNPQTITAADGSYLLSMQPQEKSYSISKLGNRSEKPNGPRFYKGTDGTNNWVPRGDPAFSLAADMISPSNYAFWTVDPETLEPTYQVTGHEVLLDRDTTIMEGNLDSYMGGKHKAKHYKYWVDSETGVLLKLQLTNDSQEIVESLEMLSVSFNIGVDRSKFSTKAPDGWIDSRSRKSISTDGE